METGLLNPILNILKGEIKRVHMNLKIWQAELPFNLFNLKTREGELKEIDLILNENTQFYGNMDTNQISFYKDFKNQKEESLSFSFFRDKNSNLKIKNTVKEKNLLKSFWINKKSKEKEELKKDDYIRMGRQILKVSKLHKKKLKKKTQNPKFDQKSIKKPNFCTITSSNYHPNKTTCRICLEIETPKNIFEKAICKCSKKMPAHINCLSKWLNKKCLKIDNEFITYWDFSQLFCDICKTKIKANSDELGGSLEIGDLKNKEEFDFILFDVFSTDFFVKKGVLRILVDQKIGNLAGKKNGVLFGRNDNCDVSFKDISVSRVHSNVFFFKGKFFVSDKISKFGTLFKLDDEVSLGDICDENVIFGKYCFKFHFFWKIFCCRKNLMKNCIVPFINQEVLRQEDNEKEQDIVKDSLKIKKIVIKSSDSLKEYNLNIMKNMKNLVEVQNKYFKKNTLNKEPINLLEEKSKFKFETVNNESVVNIIKSENLIAEQIELNSKIKKNIKFIKSERIQNEIIPNIQRPNKNSSEIISENFLNINNEISTEIINKKFSNNLENILEGSVNTTNSGSSKIEENILIENLQNINLNNITMAEKKISESFYENLVEDEIGNYLT